MKRWKQSAKCYLLLAFGLPLIELTPAFAQQHTATPHFMPRLSVNSANVDSRWRAAGKRSTSLWVYGDGPLWTKATGLDEGTGLDVDSPRLISALAENLRFTNKTIDTDNVLLGKTGNMSVLLFGNQPTHGACLDEFWIYKLGKETYMVLGGSASLALQVRPGYEAKFYAFLHRLVLWARRHDRSVRLFDDSYPT